MKAHFRENEITTSFQVTTKTWFFALTKIQNPSSLRELPRAAISKLLGLWMVLVMTVAKVMAGRQVSG